MFVSVLRASGIWCYGVAVGGYTFRWLSEQKI